MPLHQYVCFGRVTYKLRSYLLKISTFYYFVAFLRKFFNPASIILTVTLLPNPRTLTRVLAASEPLVNNCLCNFNLLSPFHLLCCSRCIFCCCCLLGRGKFTTPAYQLESSCAPCFASPQRPESGGGNLENFKSLN